MDPNTLNFDPEPEFWSNLSVSLKEKCRTNFEKNNNLEKNIFVRAIPVRPEEIFSMLSL